MTIYLKIIASLLVTFNIAFFSAQNNFYLKCQDADNLAAITNFTLRSSSQKTQFTYNENGIVSIIDFNKGDSIYIDAIPYKSEIFKRFTKMEEIVAKKNEEKFPKSGDTIIIELQMKEELLLERWKNEDALFSATDTSEVYKKVDTPPSLVDPIAFNKALSSQLHFPKYLASEGVQGNVILSAIVEKDGTLSNIKIEKSLEIPLDRIALRAMRSKAIPLVKPALLNGTPVRTIIVFPVQFKLEL